SFKLLGFLDVKNVPCARESVLYGSLGSLVMGLGHFLATSRVRRSCDVAVGGFICTMFYCRYNLAQQRIQQRMLQEGMKNRILYEGSYLDPEKEQTGIVILWEKAFATSSSRSAHLGLWQQPQATCASEKPRANSISEVELSFSQCDSRPWNRLRAVCSEAILILPASVIYHEQECVKTLNCPEHARSPLAVKSSYYLYLCQVAA
ncbi:Cytochrome c oxidase protein 20, partial [Lamprotornis superbus]